MDIQKSLKRLTKAELIALVIDLQQQSATLEEREARVKSFQALETQIALARGKRKVQS